MIKYKLNVKRNWKHGRRSESQESRSPWGRGGGSVIANGPIHVTARPLRGHGSEVLEQNTQQ